MTQEFLYGSAQLKFAVTGTPQEIGYMTLRQLEKTLKDAENALKKKRRRQWQGRQAVGYTADKNKKIAGGNKGGQN